MNKNVEVTTPNATLLAAMLAFSIVAVSNFATQVSAQTTTSSTQSGKMHLDEGIKALQSGDTQGALMHLNIADKILSGSTSASAQSGKMHLDEGIKALQSGDTQGALMHLNIADKALAGG